jgi:mono/diheme cytochrome c family protein
MNRISLTPSFRAAAIFSAVLFVLGWSVYTAADEPKPGDVWTAPARAVRRKNPIAADAKSMALGKAVYTANCFQCHGTSGKGDGPMAKDLDRKPGDLSAPKVWEQTDGSLFWKVTEGRKPMPGFQKLLSDDDRWHVVNYLHTFAPRGAGGQQR